ncbi:ABC transporter permease [Marinicella sp. W31]|uniref:ABC transporter permease n=1 Tax=Marinicella sp. W31 TaxID=3023713 RepID=UPI003757FD04
MTDTTNNISIDQDHQTWIHLLKRIKQDKAGMLALYCICFFLLIAVAVWMGYLGQSWGEISNQLYAAPSAQHWFGTNAIGQDIFDRAVFGTKVAFEVGVIVTTLSILLGAVLGALAGFNNKSWLDRFILWILAVIDSIPFYLFVAAIAFALQGTTLAMYVSMILVFWTTTARLIRAEVIRLKQQNFIEAAQSLGLNQWRIMFVHILPNTSHLLLIQATIIFVSAIKTEVILSFLGLGIKDGISWGLMIAEANADIQAGYFYNLIAASGFLFILVMAFNLFADAIQDAFNPMTSNTL